MLHRHALRQLRADALALLGGGRAVEEARERGLDPAAAAARLGGLLAAQERDRDAHDSTRSFAGFVPSQRVDSRATVPSAISALRAVFSGPSSLLPFSTAMP